MMYVSFFGLEKRKDVLSTQIANTQIESPCDSRKAWKPAFFARKQAAQSEQR